MANEDQEQHRSLPFTLHTDEICIIVEGLMREDQRVEVWEILEVAGIAKSTVHEIISDLSFCKLSACWILNCLPRTTKQKNSCFI
jgi:hypothetical protein